MTDLFEKSIQTLELPRVLERLAEQAVTAEGKERCSALRPLTDPDDVKRLLAETTAAAELMTLSGTPSFSGVKPVGASLQRDNTVSYTHLQAGQPHHPHPPGGGGGRAAGLPARRDVYKRQVPSAGAAGVSGEYEPLQAPELSGASLCVYHCLLYTSRCV